MHTKMIIENIKVLKPIVDLLLKASWKNATMIYDSVMLMNSLIDWEIERAEKLYNKNTKFKSIKFDIQQFKTNSKK